MTHQQGEKAELNIDVQDEGDSGSGQAVAFYRRVRMKIVHVLHPQQIIAYQGPSSGSCRPPDGCERHVPQAEADPLRYVWSLPLRGRAAAGLPGQDTAA
jgi:hypothetical protein